MIQLADDLPIPTWPGHLARGRGPDNRNSTWIVAHVFDKKGSNEPIYLVIDVGHYVCIECFVHVFPFLEIKFFHLPLHSGLFSQFTEILLFSKLFCYYILNVCFHNWEIKQRIRSGQVDCFVHEENEFRQTSFSSTLTRLWSCQKQVCARQIQI